MWTHRVVVRIGITLILVLGAIGGCSAGQSEDILQCESLIRSDKCDAAISLLGGITSPDLLPRALQLTADCHKRSKEWSKAIACYEKILSLSSSALSSKEIKTCMMDCYLASGDSEKSMALLKELLGAFPGDAWRFYHVIGRRFFWLHNYKSAVPYLKKALEGGKSDRNVTEYTDAKSELIDSYIALKQWNSAEILARELVVECPSREWEWCYALGRCLSTRGAYIEAEEQLRRALELRRSLKPNTTTKMIGKALLECYLADGDVEQAILLVNSLQKDYPSESTTLQHSLGRTYMIRKEYAKAEVCFAAVVKDSHERWEVRSSQIFRGECLYRIGKGKEAEQAIADYYANRPDIRAEYLLVQGAVLFYGAGDYDGAADILQQLVKDYGDIPGTYGYGLVSTARELATACYEKSGRWEEAAVCLESSTTDQSNDGGIWKRIGDNYFEAGKFEAAKKAYRKSQEASGSTAEMRAGAMYQQALCYEKQGFKRSAERLAIRVYELYPDTAVAEEARGSVYVWQGMPDLETNK